jgi:large subunit ribosomal protein L5
MNKLKEKYQKEVLPALMAELGVVNKMAVPKLEKIVLNVGTSHGLKDPKFNELVEQTLERITGQKPVKTLSKKSISNFKIREGMVVGMVVTLRGQRMYDFLEKLINITFPRVRDFRGVDPKIVDKFGNLSIGFKENIAFPEIKSDEVDRMHGLQITIATTAKNNKEGLALFKLLGFPFNKEV